jgi:hypothetical protein
MNLSYLILLRERREHLCHFTLTTFTSSHWVNLDAQVICAEPGHILTWAKMGNWGTLERLEDIFKKVFLDRFVTSEVCVLFRSTCGSRASLGGRNYWPQNVILLNSCVPLFLRFWYLLSPSLCLCLLLCWLSDYQLLISKNVRTYVDQLRSATRTNDGTEESSRWAEWISRCTLYIRVWMLWSNSFSVTFSLSSWSISTFTVLGSTVLVWVWHVLPV